MADLVFNKAIALNPNDVKALTGLGVLARIEKDYDKAAEFYNKAISIDPTYGKAYGSLLIIELKRGNYQTAVDLGEKASNLSPDELSIKANLSVAYHYHNQFEKRDSVIDEIKARGYPYADDLQLIFKGIITIDDL